MKELIKLSVFFLLTFSLMSCDYDDPYEYEDWDMDNDGIVTDEEFYPMFDEVGYYKAWDYDNDGLVEYTEWENTLVDYDFLDDDYYYDWDMDGDGVLDYDEFNKGIYTLWDTDGDGDIERIEYEEWYKTW